MKKRAKDVLIALTVLAGLLLPLLIGVVIGVGCITRACRGYWPAYYLVLAAQFACAWWALGYWTSPERDQDRIL